MTSEKEKQVRLQVPLEQAVFDELEELANRFERPVSWMAREILVAGVEQREDFMQWMAFRFIGKMLGSKRGKLQTRLLLSGDPEDVVRLQVNVPESLAAKIKEQAVSQRRIANQMAALLISWTLDDQAWLIRFVTGRFGVAVDSVLGSLAKPKKGQKNKIA